MKDFKVTVKREPSTKDYTLSTFFFNNKRMGVGVEDEYREVKVKGETRIPNGTYKLGLRYSPKFSASFFRNDEGELIRKKDRRTIKQKQEFHTQHELIHVMDVPNFQYVLWHWGNTDKDTAGCYIVGTFIAMFNDRKGVANSVNKYMEIYPIVWRNIQQAKKENEHIFVEYLNANYDSNSCV